ncbi:MAG: DUF885 domain-containing protein [Gammaproteobacteria bacterium]
MTRFSHVIAILPALWGLVGCGKPPAPAASQGTNLSAPHEGLRRIVDRYWDERPAGAAALEPQMLADSLAMERRFLTEILAVPLNSLDAESRLTYDIFRKEREQEIEGLTYPAELLPIDPFGGPLLELARAAADMGQYPLKTAQDYRNWQIQIDGSVRWIRQAIANMRDGMRRGYTSPQSIMQRALALLQGLGEDTGANVFYVPVRTLPDAIKDPERTRLSVSLNGAVKDQLLPAIRELHDFIKSDYLPRARVSVAWASLPLGTSWYAYLVALNTDTRLTPSEIHNIGVAEVERIRTRLQSLPAGPPAAPAKSDVPAADPLTAYRDLKALALAAVPALFSALPKADFEITAANPLAGPGAALAYQRATEDGATPAILYVGGGTGTTPATVDIAEFLQETVPGMHLQSALQQERVDLPKFRRWSAPRYGAQRYGGAPAFVDGWALYAVSLGEDLGLYRDDEAKRGAAFAQLRCAVALVADTGLHAKGWTRAQAVEYLRAQLALDEAGAALMTDSFVAEPGKALACKMGELEFQALRNRAQQALGDKFDYREFHGEVLRDGAMPLDILETKMKLWMEARR